MPQESFARADQLDPRATPGVRRAGAPRTVQQAHRALPGAPAIVTGVPAENPQGRRVRDATAEPSVRMPIAVAAPKTAVRKVRPGHKRTPAGATPIAPHAGATAGRINRTAGRPRAAGPGAGPPSAGQIVAGSPIGERTCGIPRRGVALRRDRLPTGSRGRVAAVVAHLIAGLEGRNARTRLGRPRTVRPIVLPTASRAPTGGPPSVGPTAGHRTGRIAGRRTARAASTVGAAGPRRRRRAPARTTPATSGARTDRIVSGLPRLTTTSREMSSIA
ncbi:Uncharacterised protein [Arthrobacter agilis]|nr:Uncharacterised protein [Arthrobacter agilis]